MKNYKLFCVLACILLIGFMVGCAGRPFQAICGVQPIGQTDAGVPYFAIACEPAK